MLESVQAVASALLPVPTVLSVFADGLSVAAASWGLTHTITTIATLLSSVVISVVVTFTAAAAAKPIAVVSTLVIIAPSVVPVIVAVVMSSPIVHSVAIAAGVVGQHWWAIFLLLHIWGPAPQDNRNSTFAVVLLRGQGIHSMLPVDVDVSAERENHSVILREVNFLAGLRVKKSELPSSTKGNTDRNILIFSTLSIKCCTIMMKRLPVGRISVPVESGAHTLLPDFEISGHSVLNVLKKGTALRCF